MAGFVGTKWWHTFGGQLILTNLRLLVIPRESGRFMERFFTPNMIEIELDSIEKVESKRSLWRHFLLTPAGFDTVTIHLKDGTNKRIQLFGSSKLKARLAR
jgi:hypothetical protein